MLHSQSKAFINRKTMKFAAAAAAMATLAGCAITMPLRPIMTSSQDKRDGNFACTAHSKCPNGSKQDRLAYRRSQSGGFLDAHHTGTRAAALVEGMSADSSGSVVALEIGAAAFPEGMVAAVAG